jgi:hypothetical protein
MSAASPKEEAIMQNLRLILRKLVRVSIVLSGLFLVALGVFFLKEPNVAAATLGVGAIQPYGVAALRGDFAGFFGAAGILILYAYYRSEPRYLIAPLLLMTLAVAGRLITFSANGHDHTMWAPIVIELVIIKVLFFGRRALAPTPAPAQDVARSGTATSVKVAIS